jgi:hypothetical protein
MKTAVVALFIASAWIGVNTAQIGPTKESNRNTAESAQQAQHNQANPALPPSPISINSANRDKNQASSPQANDGKGSIGVPPVQPVAISTDKDRPISVSAVKDWWDKALVLGTVGLVIVGGFGILYAIRTLKAINRQAELQEANLSQWVDFKPRGLLVATTSRTNPPKEVTLNLRWRVLNNTPFPFTLQKVEIKVAIGLDWEHFEIVEDDTIGPSQSSNNYLDFMVPLKLTKSQTKSFLDGGTALSITSRVSYIDVSGYEQEQYFGDLYHCAFPDKMEITEALGRPATWIRTEKGDEKPDIVLSREKYFVEASGEDPKAPGNPN